MLGIMGRPVFLVLNGMGIGFLCLSQAFPSPWGMVSATIGSAFVTIGITLPVALYFQIQSNAEAFKILNTCSRVGIESMFASRKHDAGALSDAIAAAVSKSNSVSLLGIAFRTFTDPSGESRETVRQKMNSPSTHLRVLLLDPDSVAARDRAKIEIGNATIDDIKYTLHNNLVAIAVERIRQLTRASSRQGAGSTFDGSLFSDRLKLNMEVRTYDVEPVVSIRLFDDTMFSEQYHRGRPEELVPVGSCIGKYMPVTQYRRGSTGFQFLQSHFENLWSEAKDRTQDVLDEAFRRDTGYRSAAIVESRGATGAT